MIGWYYRAQRSQALCTGLGPLAVEHRTPSVQTGIATGLLSIDGQGMCPSRCRTPAPLLSNSQIANNRYSVPASTYAVRHDVPARTGKE